MTVEDAQRRVDSIRAHASDPEAAGAAERALWRDALRAIQHGRDNAAELARVALSSADVAFPRWCA